MCTQVVCVHKLHSITFKPGLNQILSKFCFKTDMRNPLYWFQFLPRNNVIELHFHQVFRLDLEPWTSELHKTIPNTVRPSMLKNIIK